MASRTLRQGSASVTMRVPFAASSVAVVRQRLRSWMGSEGYSEECVEDGRTIVSELVANSVRHAQPLADGTIEVTWESTDAALRFSVTDGGSGTRPRTVHAPAMALAGRGMSIVETLAASWWLDGSRSHSTVHALLQVQ